MQPDDLVLHVPADQRVERGERLVEEQQRRVAGQRPGEADALLHAAGELVGVGPLVAPEADQLDDLGRLGPALLLAHAAHLEAIGDVVDHLAVRQEAEVLEDHRGVGAPQVAELALAGLDDVVAVHHDLAGGRLDEPGQQPDQRGLPGAGEAHHDEDLAGRYVERHVLDADHAAGLLLEVGATQTLVGCPDDLVRALAEDLPEVAHRQGGVAAGGHSGGGLGIGDGGHAFSGSPRNSGREERSGGAPYFVG